MKSSITSNDIARLANVSQTTVSLVFRHKWKGRVKPETAEKIIKIANENNYRTNRAASLLKSGKSNIIAFVVPDIENPFFSRILHGLNIYTNRTHHLLLLVEERTNKNWHEYIEQEILTGNIDLAFICYATYPKRFNQEIEKRIIFLDEPMKDVCCVSVDFNSAVEEAVQLFIDKGIKRIGHLKTSLVKSTFTVREQAYKRTLIKNGIKIDPKLTVVVNNYTPQAAYAAVKKSSANFQYPMAFICDDDMIAVGIYLFAREKGLKIPEDISVIGLDGTLFKDFLYPKLCSYDYDNDLLIEKVSEIAENILDNSKEFVTKTEKIKMFLPEGKSV